MVGSNAAIENFLTRGVSWSSRGASFSVVGAMDRPRKPRDHIVRVIDATESEVTYQLTVRAEYGFLIFKSRGKVEKREGISLLTSRPAGFRAHHSTLNA